MELGKRIVIEGTDGTGKTTIADMLAWQLRQNNIAVIRVDEPDSAIDVNGNILVPEARALRKIIKDGSIPRSPEANLTLFNASRFANWTQASRPALQLGHWVLQARDKKSSEGYQGYAEGMGIHKVRELTRAVMGDEYMQPDYDVILDFDDSEEEIRLNRISQRGILETPDTFESRGGDFQQKIRDGYRIIAAMDGTDIVSANQERIAIADEVWHRMMGKFGLQLTHFDWSLAA